jgi:hypothetical protein
VYIAYDNKFTHELEMIWRKIVVAEYNYCPRVSLWGGGG